MKNINAYQMNNQMLCLKNREAMFRPNNKYEAKNFGQFYYFRKIGAAFSREMTLSMKLMLEKWNN